MNTICRLFNAAIFGTFAGLLCLNYGLLAHLPVFVFMVLLVPTVSLAVYIGYNLGNN